MCGIAGIVSRAGRVEPQVLERAAERLSHRGPDGHGVFTEDGVGLVHTRLSIIDLGGGRQPLLDGGGRLALVANGEIYNFVELRQAMEAEGRGFATHSDCETILHGYALDPAGFVESLHGMFAFALYDRERGRVVIARDRLGIKPLYYAELPDQVVFASELKALLPLLGRTPEINPLAFAQFLQNQFSTGAETILQGVRRVLPGEIIEIDTDSLRLTRRRYWTPLQVQTRAIGYAEAAEEFDALFHQVMREHIRSDVPYGLFLSGGLDSAILLGMLDKLCDGPIRTYSVGYRDVEMRDELSDAEWIAGRFRTEHTALRLDRDEVFGQLVRSVWAADDLMRDYACLPTAVLAQRAGAGLKVVFSGEGGDEAFAGYGRYRPNLGRFWKNLRSPGSEGFKTRPQLQPRWTRKLFGPALAQADRQVRAPVIAAWRETPQSWSYLQRAQYTDMVTALPDNLLVKADRMLMGFGVEGRVPFLDHRVVEFGLSLPDRLKVEGGIGKHFLRRWAGRLLPPEHIHRKKRGFHVPVGEWLRGEFLDQLERRLIANPALGAWFDVTALPALFAAQRATGGVSREIFSLLQFALWHRLLVEQPGVQPSAAENPLEWIG
ncbi:asparagine synthase (glutamine-hydrolysing) [Methylomagnum ishizawai]|uniref:asparagine synthase (glutamine-hydrolyzing) n=1 Tax=Methylomagnum ishizawai TaxID=1760988 RepID=A0A1Y6D1H7_9GAMM|nr:asparagine synthase (glutamine-hydrolyzing) [Methylomagnum ishizawai]SMF96507.1 asparagine synthase (glutamine-hydrolysing) [Methylomagnum ishizawai]